MMVEKERFRTWCHHFIGKKLVMKFLAWGSDADYERMRIDVLL